MALSESRGADDDKSYCFCKQESFGDMIACENSEVLQTQIGTMSSF